MNTEQEEAFNLCCKGHNLVLTGQAGTGKTYLVRNIRNALVAQNKSVSVTCATGMATRQYDGLAVTLHKWAGLEDGRHDNQSLVRLITTDERHVNTLNVIKSTDVLIIDEVSMISSKILGQVEFLLRLVKDPSYYFGKTQVILVGDFFQLPPVKNVIYGDHGHYAFELPFFADIFPHHINLLKVHRQTEVGLVKAVAELEMGDVSDLTCNFLKALDRPIDDTKSVKLFARNIDVDVRNYEEIIKLPGDLKTYSANDDGDQQCLNKMSAPKHLGLKKGCPVILLSNMSDKLVNGLQGTVSDLHEKSVTVTFHISDTETQVCTLGNHTFTVYDPVKKIIIAKRQQIPLKPSFALTIHKAQGMSLPVVDVDCSNAFQPGQIGVAVGRAMTSVGLRVRNFSPRLCRKHPSSVYSFYQTDATITLKEDCSCCLTNTLLEETTGHSENDQTGVDTADSSSSDSKDEFSDIEENLLLALDQQEEVLNAEEIFEEPLSALSAAMSEFMDTPMEKDLKLVCQHLKDENYKSWYKDQLLKVQEMAKSYFKTDSKIETKHINSFYSTFNSYIASEEFIKSCELILGGFDGQILLTEVLFGIQKKLIKEMASQVDFVDTGLASEKTKKISDAGKGKIRYIGGYCVAKSKYRLSKYIRANLYHPKKTSEVESCIQEMRLLEKMESSGSILSDMSKFPETLNETRRKQNLHEGLTNITDSCYEFFLFLTEKCGSLLKFEKLYEFRDNMFTFLKTEIHSDESVAEKWSELCEHASLGEKIINLFLRVSFAQFRKDFLAEIKKEKGKALRKKVTEKSTKKSSKMNFNTILEDNSEGKKVSHLKLQAEIMLDNDYLKDCFSKDNLKLLGKAYEVKLSTKLNKTEMGGLLSDKLSSVV